MTSSAFDRVSNPVEAELFDRLGSDYHAPAWLRSIDPWLIADGWVGSE